MRNTKFVSGDANAICDVCGFKFKHSQLRERWDNLMVCAKDWETRHPQDLIRPIPDQQKLPWTRPEGTDVEISPYQGGICTIRNSQGATDYGVTECCRCDVNTISVTT